MAASNRSSRVAAAFFERRVQIWDAEKAKCLNEFATFFSFGGFRLALDPLGERCIAAVWRAGKRGGVARYETNTGKRIWHRQDLRQTQRVRFSPGGETVWCVPDSGPTKLLDASSGKTLDALTGLTGIFDSEYSADLPLEKRKRDYILRKQKALQISTPDICNLGCRIWSSVTSNERNWWSSSLRRLFHRNRIVETFIRQHIHFLKLWYRQTDRNFYGVQWEFQKGSFGSVVAARCQQRRTARDRSARTLLFDNRQTP
jgi:hypothetical protein